MLQIEGVERAAGTRAGLAGARAARRCVAGHRPAGPRYAATAGAMAGGFSEDEIQDLYAWVDTVPLSRPKRNIARDFSDGVLMAETVLSALRSSDYYCAAAAARPPRSSSSSSSSSSSARRGGLRSWI